MVFYRRTGLFYRRLGISPTQVSPPTGDGQQQPPPQSPPQSPSARVAVNRVVQYEQWGSFDINWLRENPEDPNDTSVVNRSAATGNEAPIRLGFDTPGIPISGVQKFRVKIMCSTSGGQVKAELWEGSTFKANLGTKSLSSAGVFQLLEWEWDSSLISNPSQVVLRLILMANLPSGYYSTKAVDWLLNVAPFSQGQQLQWPWSLAPAADLKTHFGLSLITPHGSYGISQWNNWIQFFNGRVPDVVSYLSLGSLYSWDDIAGGAGNSEDILAGQLSNAGVYFDTSWWPTTKPLHLVVGASPEDRRWRNVWTENDVVKWRTTSIWSEIKRGDYDHYYRKLWRRIARACERTQRNPRTVVIRFAPEMSGDWHPWSVGADKQSFIDGWRRVIDIMKQEVSSILGNPFWVEFPPDRALRFGENRAVERLWNLYPGDDYVDIVTVGVHDTVGMKVQEDWNNFVQYRAGKVEGLLEWYSFGNSRGKWLGVSEICSNVNTYKWWPRTEDNRVLWTNGFEPLRRRFDGKFLYIIYMLVGGDRNRTDNVATQLWQTGQDAEWGTPVKLLYKLP